MPADAEVVSKIVTFLSDLCESTDNLAVENDMGRVEYKVEQIKPGLSCLKVRFVDDDEGPLSPFRVYAAGYYRNQSMMKVEDEEGRNVLLSSDPRALLAYISW